MNAISSVSMRAIPHPDRRSSSHAHRSVLYSCCGRAAVRRDLQLRFERRVF